MQDPTALSTNKNNGEIIEWQSCDLMREKLNVKTSFYWFGFVFITATCRVEDVNFQDVGRGLCIAHILMR